MWKISLFYMVELNPTFDWACLWYVRCHGMAWHGIVCVCSVIICINKRQERQQYNTPITNNDTHKIHAQCSQLESHLSSAQLTLFTLWKSQKRVSYLVGPRKRHTISLFGVSIEFIIYFSFIFSADVLFPFTEISLCFHSAFIDNCSAVCFSRRTNQRDKKKWTEKCVHFMSSHIHFIICL